MSPPEREAQAFGVNAPKATLVPEDCSKMNFSFRILSTGQQALNLAQTSKITRTSGGAEKVRWTTDRD
jgi:hypothetical protein